VFIKKREDAMPELNTAELIAKYGWKGIYVAPCQHDSENFVPFEYTIGMTELGLPELIVFALSWRVCHGALEGAIDVLRKEGCPVDGQISQKVLQDFPVVFKTLPPDQTNKLYTCQAAFYYEPRLVSVMQIVWPDKAGRFPWQPGCDSKIVNAQSEIIRWSAIRVH
jgi:Domain of unknown function (DUF4262)